MPRHVLPLLWFSLAFLAGILAGAALPWAWTGWLALAFVPPVLALGLSRLPLPALQSPLKRLFRPLPHLGAAPSVLWIALFLGAARYQFAQPQLTPASLAWYNDRGPARIEAVVVSPPDRRDTTVQLRLRAATVALFVDGEPGASVPVDGLLLVRLPAGGDWRYGDRLELTGFPQTPPELGDFSYREFLARQGVYTYLPVAQARRLAAGQANPVLGAVYDLRERLLEVAARLFPPDEAALLSGILLGDDGRIPASLEEAFTATGTAHIIAISGFNIAILSGLFSTLFCRLLGKRRGVLAAALGIGFYTVLVGAGASVVRAALMGGLSLFARQVGRRQVGLNTLAFTAFMMCLVNPQALWDPGFQLSFFATLGLVLYAAPLQEAFIRLTSRVLPGGLAQRLAQPVGEYLLFTLAAQVTTLPVVAVHFGRVSFVALLANPLVLPPQPLVMVLGGLAALLGLVALPLGQAAAYLAWPFVAYTIRIVELLGRIPSGSVETGPLSPWLVVAFYALLFGATFAWPHRQALRPLLRPAVGLVTAGALAALTWQAALSQPDGRLRLALLPGEGQAVLVQTPSGRSLLVGGDSSPGRLLSGVSRRLPLFRPELDALVVLTDKAGEIAALPPLAARYSPGLVIWNNPSERTQAAKTFTSRLDELAIPLVPAQPGQRLDLGAGASLQVLSAGPDGAALLLEWRSFRVLWLSGEASPAAEVGVVSVVILPEITEGSAAWIEQNPPVLLMSGKNANVSDVTTLSPGPDDWVQVVTDGEQMWVEMEDNKR